MVLMFRPYKVGDEVNVGGYTGTVRGFDATSPSVTDRALRTNGAAESRYLGYVKSREQAITAAVTANPAWCRHGPRPAANPAAMSSSHTHRRAVSAAV